MYSVTLNFVNDGIKYTECVLQTGLQFMYYSLARSPSNISEYVSIGLYKSSLQGQNVTLVTFEILQ